jgi:hypothetical protein
LLVAAQRLFRQGHAPTRGWNNNNKQNGVDEGKDQSYNCMRYILASFDPEKPEPYFYAFIHRQSDIATPNRLELDRDRARARFTCTNERKAPDATRSQLIVIAF